MPTTNSGRLHFGGIPTEIDVRKLVEQFGVPKEGAKITWEELEETLEMDRSVQRFRTVTNAWRKKLFREHGLLVKAIGMGEGLEIATPSQRIDVSSRQFKHGMRRIRRASHIAISTDRGRLSEDEKRVQDHLSAVAAQMIGMARVEAKKLEYPTPAKKVSN